MRKILITLGVLVLLGFAVFQVATGTRSGQDFLLERAVNAAMSQPPESMEYDGLRAFMCGTASPLPARDRAQACVAVLAGDQIYLVDAGTGSAATAQRGRLPLNYLKGVLLTHFHSDHISGIGDFNLASWVAGRPERLEVVGPLGVEKVVDGINNMYAHDRVYRVAHHGSDLLSPDLGLLQARAIAPGVILDEDGLQITAFVVDHSPVDPAVGYRFDYRGRSVVVSGDSIATETLQAASQNADLLLHDAISLPIVQAMEQGARKAGNERLTKILYDIQDYHASIVSLTPLAEKAGVKQLALYHLVPPPQNFVMEKIFARDLPDNVIITKDGMWFEMPTGSDDIDVR